MDEDAERKLNIPHTKQKGFISAIADVITVYGNENRVTLLFSVESGDVISEVFKVGKDKPTDISGDSTQMIQIREDLARIHISKPVAKFLLSQLKKILESDSGK